MESQHDESIERARGAQKGNTNAQTNGDYSRKRQQKERGFKAIKGSTREGKRVYAWLDYTLKKKGGRSKPTRGDLKRWRKEALSHVLPDTREKIEAGIFYLWRALCLESYILDDAKRRGTPINRRRGILPTIHEQYDTAMGQWQKINDELQLKPRANGNGNNPNLRELLEEIDGD